MAQPPKFTVGQEVWLIEQRQPAHLVPVTKVGRTLVTVERHGRARQFRMDTGCENGPVVGYAVMIRTMDEQVAVDRLAAAKRELNKAGLTISWSAQDDLGVETIEALALVATDHPAGALPEPVAMAIATLKAYRADTQEG